MSRQLKWWLPVFVLVLALGVLTFKYQKGNNERQPDILDKQPSQKIALRLPSFAINLNPAKMADVESRQIATLLHAGLVLQTQDGHIVPMLAQKWQQKGNVWEFELKPGLTFSNGDALTSADVVRSLCNSMQPSAALAWALASISKKPAPDGKTFECIGLSAVSSHVLRIEETKPSKSLFDALGGPAGWILPKPEVKEGAYGVLPGAGVF